MHFVEGFHATPLSPPWVPPISGFRDLYAKRKFLAVRHKQGCSLTDARRAEQPLFLNPSPRKPPPQKQIASSYIFVLAISLTLSLTLIMKIFYALICILFTPLFAVNKEAEPKVKQIAEQVSKDLTAKIIELKLNKSVMEQFFDSLDQDEVKSVSLEWSKLVKKAGYSFTKESFITRKRDADLVFYFDNDDCSKGSIFGHDDKKGYLFPIENKNLSEISLEEIPTNESKTKVGFLPITKKDEGLGFWIKTTSGRFVLAVIKKVEPAEFKDIQEGANAKVELEWTWQAKVK
ncbi:hypothetical protein OAG38_07055 [Akkermansiaceae bacterium]|nr:hypothetical protein [Akkermansiaceae bacterium]